jgi:hypothetical protein
VVSGNAAGVVKAEIKAADIALPCAFSLRLIQFIFEQLIDGLRVGGPLGSLHHLADKEADHLATLVGFSCLVLIHLGLVVGQYFINNRFNGSRVGNLLEALGINDFISRLALTGPEGSENLFGCLAVDGVITQTF